MKILLIIGVVVLFIWLSSKLKPLKVGNVVLVTGGVKVGKTTFSVWLTEHINKIKVFGVKIYNVFFRWFSKDKSKVPLPKIYSNIPLKVPFVPLTKDLIYRRKRFEYGSTAYVCEASLLASQNDYNDIDLSENLALLVKLFAHETKGGTIIFDTQCISDLHYGIKRNLSSYLYIHHKTVVPFFVILKVREMVYLDGVTNTLDTDVEKSPLQTVIIPKKVWKHFDCYCYSALTDDLEVENTEVKTKDLKARNVLSFRKYREYLIGGKKNDKKKI